MPLINKPGEHFDVLTYTGTGKVVTVGGNAQLSTAQSKFGGTSAAFDGTGDYLTIADSTDFTMGSGDFTVEFWVRFNTVSVRQYIVYQGNNSGTGSSISFTAIEIGADSKITAYSFVGSTSYMAGPSSVLSTGTWYHVAQVRNGTTITLYIDGTASGSVSIGSSSVNDSSDALKIGDYTTVAGGSPLNGYVDDLRIYKGVAKYTANFTAPTAALPIGPDDPYWQYCVAALPFDGNNASTSIPCTSYKAETQNGLSFSPGLVWIKSRSNGSASTNHNLYDAGRGMTPTSSPKFATDTTDAEINFPGYGVIGTTPNGFLLGGGGSLSNFLSYTYVAWCWKASDTAASNTDGTITSTVRANTTAGFSIVTYAGNGVNNASVGHGLGVAPVFYLVKNRTTAANNSIVYTTLVDGTMDYLFATTTSAKADLTTSLPTSSLAYLSSGGASNASGSNFVMYAWAPVAGFSAFGVYTGNGSSNGPFVNLGFRPALVIIKCTSTTGSWVMLDDKRDGYNVDNDPLYVNQFAAEGTTDLADLLSNGFKIRSNSSDVNTNAATYLYAAWAEMPFKHAIAR